MVILLLFACSERGPSNHLGVDPLSCRIGQEPIDLDTSVEGGPTARDVIESLGSRVVPGDPAWPAMGIHFDIDGARAERIEMATRCVYEDSHDLLTFEVPVQFGSIASGLDAGWDTMYAAYVDRHGVMTASATHRWVVDSAWTPGEGDLVDIVDAEIQENGPPVGRVFLFTVALEWPERTMSLTAEYHPHPDSSDPQRWNTRPDFPFESTFELR